jgi:hypothetical protein
VAINLTSNAENKQEMHTKLQQENIQEEDH